MPKIITAQFLSDINLIDTPRSSYSDFFYQLRTWNNDKTDTAISILYESSRGCWWGEYHKCTFCGVNGWNKHYRYKSEEKVMNELTGILQENPQIKHIQMVDTLMPRKYFENLIPNIKKNFPNISVFYEQRADLTLEQVVQLKHSGINYTQVGIEALSSNLLKLINKGVTAEQNIKFLRYCKSAGLLIGWNLLTEIPNDKENDWDNFLKIVPMIYHLNAPLLVRPLEIARFSPYFENPQNYSISNIAPAEVYSDIYPSTSNKDDIAWLFSACYSSASKDFKDLNKRIREVSEKWMNKWKHGAKNIPTLRVVSRNNILFLEDSRFGSLSREEITRERAYIALYGIDDYTADSDLAWAEEHQLLLKYENNNIPLATAHPNLFKLLKQGEK